MLNKLSIKNVALIESAEIDYAEGFNVMSGETGSGKSVVIQSLNFVLGAKADKTLIRSGAEYCFVCAEFDVSGNSEIYSLYDEFDFERDDLLIVARKLTIDGKTSVKLNGNTVNLSMLKRFTSKLVDVHGQSEHYELLKEENQLKLIDEYAAKDAEDKKNEINAIRLEYAAIKKELDSLGGDEAKRLLRLDVLEYQINEIEKADLKENEETELIGLRDKLLNQEKITTALSAIKSAFTEEGGLLDVLSNASRISSGISSFGADYYELSERIGSLSAEADDIAETAGAYVDDSEYPEANVDDVEERLELIKTLKRKYGNDYAEITFFLNNAKEERDKLLNFNELAEKLLKEKSDKEKALYKEYKILSEIRRKAANDFSAKVSKELAELGMNKAVFAVEFSDFPSIEECSFSGEGVDSVKFLFSANLGEPLKPLSGVISGGELSRFMLAVKAQSARFDSISTYIFDEIDAGISGKIASVVAEKLYKISLGVQVVAITHLPQISAFSDNSVYVSKSEENGKTLTSIKTLDKKEKIEEIIRLVGGTSDSSAAKKHAETLISEANAKKTVIKSRAL